MKMNRLFRLTPFIGMVVALALLIVFIMNLTDAKADNFDGERAYQDVITQLSFGPRYPSSPGHEEEVLWLQSQLLESNWQVEIQAMDYLGCPVENVIAHRESASDDWVLLGAHYDTRLYADQEQNLADRVSPVPGANDGASGVAVLLELARIVPLNLDKDITLVFFDCEDNGGIDGQDWALGSRAYVDSLSAYPDKVVIIDMIGDADLQIYREKASDDVLMDEIWSVAAELEIDAFINTPKYRMLDDHTAFVLAGIPAIDLIDFDYPFWHTLQDTEDKVSVESLQAVGDVLVKWLITP